MSTWTRPAPGTAKMILPVLFALGVAMLIGTWRISYEMESWFTESHLVGYTCCVTEQDLPAVGTPERTLSDFFRVSPGMHLPSLVFVMANLTLFVISVRRAPRDYWWLPYLFVALNIVYLLVDLMFTGLSWSIGDWVAGPRTTVYAGYSRTWYGIVMHLILWVCLFIVLFRAPVKLTRNSQAAAP